MRIPDMMMPHRVDLHPLGGITASGRKPGATIPNVRALVEDEETVTRDAQGNETVSGAKITLDPENAVPLNSTVTLWKGQPGERTATLKSYTGRSNTMLEFVSYRLE